MSSDQAEIGAAEQDVGGIPPNSCVSLHILDDSGVLFDAVNGRTYALNTTATFIWCCVDEGQGPAEITQRLRETFGLSSAEASRYVNSALQSWREAGLLESRYARRPAKDQASAVDASEYWASSGLATAGDLDGERRFYRLLDTEFYLRVGEPRLREELDVLLAPLAISAVSRTPKRLELTGSSSGFFLWKDRARFARCEESNEIVPLIKASLIRIALENSSDFGAIHSAAVSRGNHCLLIVGKSGSGKSTLSAALVGAGFRLLGDDTTVLARDTLQARPVPFAICLKDGAWPLLADRFPEIWRQPLHHRLDGKYVRYLPTTGTAWLDPAAALPISALVFLRREVGARPQLAPLAKAEALSRLTMEFSPLGKGLDDVKIGQLVTWIAKIPCYDLHFASLDDGVQQLSDFCA